MKVLYRTSLLIKQKDKIFDPENIPNNQIISLFDDNNIDKNDMNENIIPKSHCFKVKSCVKVTCTCKVQFQAKIIGVL